MLNELILKAKQRHAQIESLLKEQATFLSPTLTDPLQLFSLYKAVQSQFAGLIPRELRMRFVFIAVYLYSPRTIICQSPIKSGLCYQMGRVINRCRTEVSELFTEARARYDCGEQFRDDVCDLCSVFPTPIPSVGKTGPKSLVVIPPLNNFAKSTKMNAKIAKEQEITDDYNEIIDRLKNARETQDISQYELAKSSGLKQSTISDIEKKKKRPSLISIIRMSRALGEMIVL